MGGLFQGIPPFAGEGIASGVALQAAYFDLKNQIDAILVSSGTLAATLTLGNLTGGRNIRMSNGDLVTDVTGVIQMDFGSGTGWSVSTDSGAFLTPYIDVTPTVARITGLAGGEVIIDNLSTSVLHNTEVEINSALISLAGTTVNAAALTGSILTKNGTAGAVALGNAVGNGFMFGANTVSISTNGVEKWMVNSSGALNPIAANTYDIGGSTTIRDIGVGRNVIVGGIVSAAAGAVGAPSYTFTGNLTDGFYSVSGTQIGVAINGALSTVFDAAGVSVGQVTELVGGAGIILASTTGDILAKTTAYPSGLLKITNAGEVFLGDWNGDASDTFIKVNDTTTTVEIRGDGGIDAVSLSGTIALTPNTGWTASVGTASKAGIDSDNVIFTVGALQDLARVVVAIQNTLMTKGFFVA